MSVEQKTLVFAEPSILDWAAKVVRKQIELYNVPEDAWVPSVDDVMKTIDVPQFLRPGVYEIVELVNKRARQPDLWQAQKDGNGKVVAHYILE